MKISNKKKNEFNMIS